MFSVFEALNTKWQHDPYLITKIPLSGGLEKRTVLAGLIAGIARAIVENPFEYAKVKRQTGQSWILQDIYKGFSATLPRGVILTSVFFAVIDSFRRHTRFLEHETGMFITAGSAAVISFWAIWPLETLKNLAQAETKGVGNSNIERAQFIYQNQGIAGFWRGFIPGAWSRLIANGIAMILAVYSQKVLTDCGLRD